MEDHLAGTAGGGRGGGGAGRATSLPLFVWVDFFSDSIYLQSVK